jgi:hypothetical protein
MLGGTLTLWCHAKEVICAHRQYISLDSQAQSFMDYLRSLSPTERLRKAGVFSKKF